MQPRKPRMGTQIMTVKSIQKKKSIQKCGRCVETRLLSIFPSKNHANEMMPNVLFADENCYIKNRLTSGITSERGLFRLR